MFTIRKSSFTILALLFISATSQAAAPPSNKPQLLTLTPNRIFIPDGFDDNDNSQLVLAGAFPNTCYRTGPVEMKVDHVTRTITLTNKGFFYDGCWCLDVQVPYTQVVNLGVLDIGNYKVNVAQRQGGTVQMGTLPIKRASNRGPDDYPYAPLDEAYFKNDTATGAKTLVMKGSFKTTCMSFKERPRVLYRPGDVTVVLPIVDVQTTGCAPANTPFEVEADITGTPGMESLIHIRSLNGTSINKVTTF